MSAEFRYTDPVIGKERIIDISEWYLRVDVADTLLSYKSLPLVFLSAAIDLGLGEDHEIVKVQNSARVCIVKDR